MVEFNLENTLQSGFGDNPLTFSFLGKSGETLPEVLDVKSEVEEAMQQHQ